MSQGKTESRRPKFAREQPFRRALQERVEAHFESTGTAMSGGLRMAGKSIFILGWLVGSYALLLWVAREWWQSALAGLSLALAIAGTGMCIQHDANHGAHSESRWVNGLFKRSLDLLGVSSYIWSHTHNVFHHTYTNIDGIDQDIDLAPAARLAKGQKHHWFHRYQHLYMWPLYGFTMFYFVLAEDFVQLKRARYGPNRFPSPKGMELILVFACKLLVVTWSILVPLLYHPWYVVLVVFSAVWLIAGFVFGLTFQLAHCVPDCAFPEVSEDSPDLESEWALHQVATTADFAKKNRLVTWYVGGLNYQIEHHLFPKVCHIHYPQIAPIVEQTCRDFDVPYFEYRSVAKALVAHGRQLVAMGTPPTKRGPSLARYQS